ncbi:Synergin gamma [Trichoplax sp. H2]|nr:Synergin gamma [Trichoplax sp. H2]|eukprot:RDD44459.1 Synergin gamma [Trichoplax sp. H2]
MYPYNQQQGYYDNSVGDCNNYRRNQATGHTPAQHFGMQTITQGYDVMMQQQNVIYGNVSNQAIPNQNIRHQIYYPQQQQQIAANNVQQPSYRPLTNIQQMGITVEQQAAHKRMIEQQLKQQKLLIEQEKEFKRKQYFQEQKERLKAISTKKSQSNTISQMSSVSGVTTPDLSSQTQISFNAMWERTTDSVINASPKNQKQVGAPSALNTKAGISTAPTNFSMQSSMSDVRMISIPNALHGPIPTTDDFSNFQQAIGSSEFTNGSQYGKTSSNIVTSNALTENQTLSPLQNPTLATSNAIQGEDDFGDFMTGFSDESSQNHQLSHEQTPCQIASIAESKYPEGSFTVISQSKSDNDSLTKYTKQSLAKTSPTQQVISDKNGKFPEVTSSTVAKSQKSSITSTIKNESLLGINNTVSRAAGALDNHTEINFTYPSWCLQDSEIPQLYKRVYEVVAAPNGDVTTTKIKSILLSSGVNKKTLYKIWETSNREQPGTLKRQELYLALGLVALAQAGCEIDQLMSSFTTCSSAPIPKIKLDNDILTTETASSERTKGETALPSFQLPKYNATDNPEADLQPGIEPTVFTKNIETKNWQAFSTPISDFQSQPSESSTTANDKYSIFREITVKPDNKSQFTFQEPTSEDIDDDYGAFKHFDNDPSLTPKNQGEYNLMSDSSVNQEHQDNFKPTPAPDKQPILGISNFSAIDASISDWQVTTESSKSNQIHNELLYDPNKIETKKSAALSYDPYAILKHVNEQSPSKEDSLKNPKNVPVTDTNEFDDFGEFNSATTASFNANLPTNIKSNSEFTAMSEKAKDNFKASSVSNFLNQNQETTKPDKQSEEWSDFSTFTVTSVDLAKDGEFKNVNHFEEENTFNLKHLDSNNLGDYTFTSNLPDVGGDLNEIGSDSVLDILQPGSTADTQKFQSQTLITAAGKTSDVCIETSYDIDRYRALSIDAEPTDTIFNKWHSCLEKALQDVQNGIDVLLSTKKYEILQEIVQCNKGLLFIRALLEIFKVVCRIDAAASRSDIDLLDVKDTVSTIKLKWVQLVQNIDKYSEELSSNFNFKSQCLTAGELATNCNHIACGVCLLNVNKTDLTSENIITYGGRKYHSGCANFWCNRISCILPALQALELR